MVEMPTHRFTCMAHRKNSISRRAVDEILNLPVKKTEKVAWYIETAVAIWANGKITRKTAMEYLLLQMVISTLAHGKMTRGMVPGLIPLQMGLSKEVSGLTTNYKKPFRTN